MQLNVKACTTWHEIFRNSFLSVIKSLNSVNFAVAVKIIQTASPRCLEKIKSNAEVDIFIIKEMLQVWQLR